MKVGTSPIYLIPGQEPQLDKYSQHLNSKQREAFDLLKEKKFLKDSEQHPAIRVALRSLHDFAFHFKRNEEIYWRYLTSKESEFEDNSKSKQEETLPIKEISEQKEKQIEQQKQEVPLKEEKQVQEQPQKQELNIFDKPKEETKPEKEKPKKKPVKRKTPASQKANQKFFEKIKEFLANQGIIITGIEGFSKTELFLKIRHNEQDQLAIAYNKKRITEADLIKANKKAKESNLPYIILTKGEQTKKFLDFLEAAKNLRNLKKFE